MEGIGVSSHITCSDRTTSLGMKEEGSRGMGQRRRTEPCERGSGGCSATEIQLYSMCSGEEDRIRGWESRDGGEEEQRQRHGKRWVKRKNTLAFNLQREGIHSRNERENGAYQKICCR